MRASLTLALGLVAAAPVPQKALVKPRRLQATAAECIVDIFDFIPFQEVDGVLTCLPSDAAVIEFTYSAIEINNLGGVPSICPTSQVDRFGAPVTCVTEGALRAACTADS